ncbi:MAG: DUF2625 domain-containing protein [Nocardiaceae bacterium]|nr:DUF2625 domain-containing protein [Nocardiaceae bacterium]
MNSRDSDSAWPDVCAEVENATTTVSVLPVDRLRGRRLCERIGVTEYSTLGALVMNTGGLVIDHGWLRVLGGGGSGLPDVVEASGLDDGLVPAGLIVAHDAVGGRFAIDGGGLGIQPGEVCYWGPDTLQWMGIGAGHSSFVSWALNGGLTDFYAYLRWQGWESEASNLGLDEGLSIWPPPFTKEGGRDLGAASRRPIPFNELVAFYLDTARQLDALEDGQKVRLVIED